jgi:co-chaperonin GroES (HSP10)
MAKNMPKIIPLGERVLLELSMTSKTEGGLELPEQHLQYAVVHSIGNGVDKIIYPLKEGDKVFLPKGINVGEKIIDRETNKITHLLVSIGHIAAIVRD